MTFVTHVASAARQQTGEMAFHNWTAIATRPGPLDLGQEGQDIAGIARIPLGHRVRKENARGGVRHHARLSTKRRGALTLAFENGSDGAIVRIDELTVTEVFALGEPCGWLADV